MKYRSKDWLKIYLSPFKPIIPKFYMGKLSIGVPYFYPRKWIKVKNMEYKTAIPKKIGFDFVSLGWKTKWTDLDIRHEWSPIWSFVFFNWQIALSFIPDNESDYWECWLIYEYHTDKTKSVKERIEQAKNLFPCVWISMKDDIEQKICYWDLILRNKYL